MPDTLALRGLAVDCRIGVTEQERATPQTVHLDVEVVIDAAKTAATDQVKDAVDYAALMAVVRELAGSRAFTLMETLAEATASLILEQFGTPSVRVRVRKRALPGIDDAAVEITRATSGGRSRRRSPFPRGGPT